MVTKREQIVIAARKWLGTPWHHHQRCLSYGVDCVQFLAAVADEAGIDYGGNWDNYYRLPHGDQLKKEFSERFTEIPISAAQTGDILLFRFSGIPHHCALLSPIGIIHASILARKVVEHGLEGQWKRRLIGAFNPLAK